MTQLTIQDVNDLEDILSGNSQHVHPDRRGDLLVLIHTIKYELEEFERRQKEVEERRSQVVPLEVPNFADVNPGTLVKRSDHYIKENCWTDSEREKAKDQIGIVSSIKLSEDDICVAIAFPLVHWAGESFPNMSHPLNVKLANGETLPTITMNANQQVKKK